jgi:hypothetical protein
LNYAGKFDAALSSDGQGLRSSASDHVDSFTAKAHGHVPDGAVVIADPNLIFHGEFKRTGVDLVLSHDGHEFVVHDYFRGDKRAAIASPDGAHLTGDIVSALTGYVQVAQAAPAAAAAQVIGHVTKLTGSATAIRNGVSVILNNGDNVEKGDVVSTGSDSTLGVTFIDGTVFGLSSNARMVLNEMVYDPNGSNNSSLLSLVAGTITFVAGDTAKHGDMKIDTPVATMGIRGTAVLTEINFVVPQGGGDPQPQANFQVLVEPNGTTGSYILFDKLTLLPIATVNQAGQMIQISGGNVSVTNALLSPDVQKLITDVFTLKFTDNNSNTKLTTNFTDTITQDGNNVLIKTAGGATATATFTNTVTNNGSGPGQGGPDKAAERIPGPPDARTLDANGNVTTAFATNEHAAATGDLADTTGAPVPPDVITFRVTFVDQNLGDRPTVSVSVDASNYTYQDAGHHDVTASLTALQKQNIAATQVQIGVAADGGNNNNGSAVLTYTVPDHAFDFLGAGETLTLTYNVSVDNNFAIQPETKTIPITITITGTNDKPVITTSVPTITFSGGTSVPGGPLISDESTSGTLNFADVDLTDTHTVAVALTSASLPDGSVVPPGPLAEFQKAMSVAIAAGADSTGDGSGTVNWSLADLPVYLADFIPKNEVLTLVYTVTVTDEHGATAQQTITVTITGTDAPAVVWIATEKDGAPSGGSWKDAANWATGTVPTIDDDVIVITDQLHGLTPSFPATIDAPAFAKSVTMNDFGGPPPQLINQSSLTIAGSLDMSADSIFTNAATGTMSLGGLAEILDTSVFTNAGYLTLKAGGDFAVGTTITNSGTLELFGGTLKTLAEIHNAGGTLKTDVDATLIVDGATIDGGTVAILGTLELDGTSLIENGTLNNSGAVNVKGTASFAAESVDNTPTGLIEVLANGSLTIHQGSSVTNAGHITVDASGKLIVNDATIGAGAVIGAGNGEGEGGPIFNAGLQSAGTITVNGEIDLTGDAVLSDGVLNNNALFNVSGTGNALSGETVTNAGTIEVLDGALAIDQGSTVDNSSGNIIIDGNAVLTLDDATIGGGAITGDGGIDVTGASTIDSGATLSVATVTVGAKLTLDGITVSGSTITNNASVELDNTVQLKGGAKIQGGPVTNNGTLQIAGAATLLNDVVTNNGTVTVDGSQTLTLSGTEISGGTINGSGTIDVAGASRIDGGATLSTSAVTAGAKLTLDGITVSGSVITDNSSIELDNTVQLKGGAKIQGGPVTNNGTLEIAGAATLLNDVVTNNGTVTVDDGQTLVLSGTEISGGVINGVGTIDVAADSTIDGSATLSTSLVTVESGKLLTLNTVTLDGTRIVDGGVDAGGTVAFDGTVTLNGVTIQGTPTASKSSILNHGTLDSFGTSSITNTDVTNYSLIEALGGILTIASSVSITNYGTIQASHGELDINQELVFNWGMLAAINGGTLKLIAMEVDNDANDASVWVDTQSKLDLVGATINDGKVTISGTLQSSGTSAINRADITNTGTLEAIAGGTLTLTNVNITNGSGTVTIDGSQALTLSGTEISGGTIDGSGSIDVTGASRIDGGATLSASAVTAGAKLTLDGITVSGSTITDNASIELDNTVQLKGGAKIQGGPVTNNGTLQIAGAATLLNDVVTNGGTVKVDGSQTLTLSGTEISGGTINGSGTIDVTGASKIDGGATLSTSSVTADAQLTLDGIVVSGSVITNNSSIELDNTVQLKGGAKIQGGPVTNNGTLEIAGAATLLNDVLINSGMVTIDDSQTLTLSGTEISGGTINNYNGLSGGTIDVTGNSKFDGNATLNKGGVTVESGVTLTLDDVTVAGAAITNHGTVKVDENSKLTLSGASLAGGTLTIAGTLESVGTSAITDADITNTGTITVTSGKLTIDPDVLHTITNSHLIQANNGELDITGELIVNSADIMALGGGILKLTSLTVTNSGGMVTVDGTSKLYLSDVSINGGSLNNSGHLYGVSGSNNVAVAVTNTGTIEVQAGTLNLSGGLTGAGQLVIDDQATLELGGANAQTVTFAGGADTLKLDKTSHGFTGTITGQATTAGTFTVTGNANITTSQGDALDFTASGGSIGSRGDIVLTPTGTLSGANNGIAVTQNGIGNISLTTVGDVTGTAGDGIVLHDGATGAGDISATIGGAATGAVGLDVVAKGDGDVTITNNGHITGTASFGISVVKDGTGSTHITNTGSVVGAGGSAVISIHENTTGAATIDNSGTIGPDAASVTSTTSAIFETGGAIEINNTGHINGNISVASATFDNESSGTWTVSGTSVFGTLSTIDNAGEIDLLDGASISSADGLTFGIANSGKIESWGATSITGKIVNTNTIEIHTDGTLSLFGSLSGSGSVTIDAGATLYLDAIVSQTITFAGVGAELEIETSSFGGSIAGFAANEKLDVSTIAYGEHTTATYDAATHNLVVRDAYDHSITLKLIGDYSDAHFITSSDGNGGTTVELVPVDHWINSASGDWNTASNWSVGVPAASYDVKLDAPGSYTVDSTGSVTIQDLTVASGVTLLTEPGTVFTVKGEVVLNGLIEAGPFSGNDVSTIDIKGDITGTGAIEISNKAVVEIEGSVSGITVYYDNGLGNLILDESRDFHGLISGSPAGASLSSNNLIDLKDLAWTSTMSAQANYNADTNITTVGFYNGTTNVTLSFLGRDVNWHLQSDGHGGTTVYDPLAEAPMTIESGSVLNLSEASSQVVTFANGSGTTGTLAIQHAADFTGVVNGFAGDGTVANSDLLDLKDIGFSTLTGVSYSENADHLGGALTLSDGTDTAIIKFAGSYSIDSFHFVSDGNGGTLVVDPPTAPILVGTSGQDQFTFTNSTHSVQNTIVDFEVGQDKIDLHAFADIKSFGDIVITQQASDALVTLDDHQSILLKKLVASSLHASDFILANHA